ncbi:MAG TPA: hemerythrin domain-containing protein [Candidatus Bathyarchaeia archaeon]|nr:hemerythrin domain-containing protein [Candidatus Bathyarchaeia archaeon]
MTHPLDVIRVFHNAFRNDVQLIDAAALDAARGKEDCAATVERFRFFNEVLVWHADGEEEAVFPRLEGVAPMVAEPYVKDHRGLEAAFDELDRSYALADSLRTARATAAFRFHLDMHLGKEDEHLYRIFKERVPLPEQAKAIGIMASKVPQDRFAELVGWLFPLVGLDDRETMIHIYHAMMPEPVFASTKELVKKAIGNDWAELTQRIPTL